MADINPEMTVRDLVVAHPRTRRILDEYGLDYCCGGGVKLSDAAARAGREVGPLIGALQEAAGEPVPDDQRERNWSDARMEELMSHIEETHHRYLKHEFKRLAGLFEKVLAAHGDAHGEMLSAMRQTFQSLWAEVEPHLTKEEQVLFPYIRALERSLTEGGAPPPTHCGTVENPIAQMQREHENAGRALEELKRLSNGYALPDDACEAFSALYDGLRELDADLREHIHLENNILFPNAVDAERRARGEEA